MGWMDQERALQLPRARQLVTQLLRPAVFSDSVPLTITAYHVPGEPVTAREALAWRCSRRSRSARHGAADGGGHPWCFACAATFPLGGRVGRSLRG